MIISYEEFEDAIKSYWKSNADAGSVRAGKQFDQLVKIIAKRFLDAGYPRDEVRVTRKQGIALPGYYRAQKRWDLVITYKSTLVAAIECKSINLGSLSNNFNNRLEEALGTAIDLKRAVLGNQIPRRKALARIFLSHGRRASLTAPSKDRTNRNRNHGGTLEGRILSEKI